MKVGVYAILIAALVPIQAVVLPHLSLWGVKPDVGFIFVCLVGLFEGELEGLLVGMAVGFVMSLFSAEELIVGIVTKAGVGYMAGIAGRQVVDLAPVMLVAGLFAASCVVGVLTAFTLRSNEENLVLWGLKSIILPQACYNAVIGGVLYWVAWSRLSIERWGSEYRV